MKDFNTIAQDAIRGMIEGFFVRRDGAKIPSSDVSYNYDAKDFLLRNFPYTIGGMSYSKEGRFHLDCEHPYDIVHFELPDETVYVNTWKTDWDYLREDALTVRELIEKLQKYPEDAIVVYYESELDLGGDASGLIQLDDPDFDEEHHAVIF